MVRKTVEEGRCFRKFDAHAHALGPKADFVDVLNALGVDAVLNLSYSGFWEPEGIVEYEELLRAETGEYPGRFRFASAFNVTRLFEDGYADEVIAKLENDVERHGAVAVKVWKDIGMMLTGPDGRFVFCDDERFARVFDYVAIKGLTVVMHIGDPRAAWMPLETESPHYGYYSAHPEFHWYGRDDKPSHEEIMAHRDALVKRYPEVTFVGAHLASLEHDLEELAAFLDAHPNACVDTAARLGDLQRMPDEEVREFFVRHQDRILYGSDWECREGAFSGEGKREMYIDVFRKGFGYFEKMLELPEDVLRKFYWENAERLFATAEQRH